MRKTHLEQSASAWQAAQQSGQLATACCPRSACFHPQPACTTGQLAVGFGFGGSGAGVGFVGVGGEGDGDGDGGEAQSMRPEHDFAFDPLLLRLEEDLFPPHTRVTFVSP